MPVGTRRVNLAAYLHEPPVGRPAVVLGVKHGEEAFSADEQAVDGERIAALQTPVVFEISEVIGQVAGPDPHARFRRVTPLARSPTPALSSTLIQTHRCLPLAE